jgi:hypothetical protein
MAIASQFQTTFPQSSPSAKLSLTTVSCVATLDTTRLTVINLSTIDTRNTVDREESIFF